MQLGYNAVGNDMVTTENGRRLGAALTGSSIQCHWERFGKLFDSEYKGLILILNRAGSEVSMVNSSNYFLSHGGLVCSLGLQTLEKAGLLGYLKYLYFMQYGWILKGEDFVN